LEVNVAARAMTLDEMSASAAAWTEKGTRALLLTAGRDCAREERTAGVGVGGRRERAEEGEEEVVQRIPGEEKSCSVRES